MSVRTTARPRALAALALSATLLAGGLSACSSQAAGDDKDDARRGHAAGDDVPAVVVSTNLASAQSVPVDSRLKLSIEHGTLTAVSVRSAEGTLPGALAADGATWKATGRLEPGQEYVVRTVAEDESGAAIRTTKRFRTADLSLDQQTWADVAPLDGETVGIGMPVIVTFDVPVADRATIEKHMKVVSSPAQRGSWHWLNDNEVHWRPATYWKAGTDVTVDVDINSVPAGGGIYGQESRHIQFHVGDAHVYKVNAQTHQMQVYANGSLLRTIPITTGKEGFTTRSGVKVIVEKFREKRMNSETVGIPAGSADAYDIDDVEYAMRLTYSGEFIHAAPWSVGQQGYANVSHGCTGMSTDNAAWLYGMTIRGDVVEYVGTDRPMTFDNGYGDWNVSFPDYRSGSAL
jgi:lipoprotein-anchoring transpeptidase ErfK/SrfK